MTLHNFNEFLQQKSRLNMFYQVWSKSFLCKSMLSKTCNYIHWHFHSKNWNEFFCRAISYFLRRQKIPTVEEKRIVSVFLKLTFQEWFEFNFKCHNKINVYPPESKASKELANFIKIKNTHHPLSCLWRM